jgi:hypothetical protein
MIKSTSQLRTACCHTTLASLGGTSAAHRHRRHIACLGSTSLQRESPAPQKPKISRSVARQRSVTRQRACESGGRRPPASQPPASQTKHDPDCSRGCAVCVPPASRSSSALGPAHTPCARVLSVRAWGGAARPRCVRPSPGRTPQPKPPARGRTAEQPLGERRQRLPGKRRSRWQGRLRNDCSARWTASYRLPCSVNRPLCEHSHTVLVAANGAFWLRAAPANVRPMRRSSQKLRQRRAHAMQRMAVCCALVAWYALAYHAEASSRHLLRRYVRIARERGSLESCACSRYRAPQQLCKCRTDTNCMPAAITSLPYAGRRSSRSLQQTSGFPFQSSCTSGCAQSPWTIVVCT